MMFIEVAMDLMQPRLMADIIDIGVASGNTTFIFSVGGKMIFVALIGLVGGAGCSVFSAIAAMNMGEKLRQGIFDKIQMFSFLELDKFKTSSLITRLTNDVTQVQNMMLMALRIMVRAPLICIGGLIMAVALSPKLSLVFLVAVILILKKSFPVFSSVQEKIDRINLVMRENILGVRVIRAFTLENMQGSRFDEANYDLMDKNIRAQNIKILIMDDSSSALDMEQKQGLKLL